MEYTRRLIYGRTRTHDAEYRMAVNYFRCLEKALTAVNLLLSRDMEQIKDQDMHSAKSVLYAAIERVGMRAERLMSIQRKLRELLSLVTMYGDFQEHERRVGLQILEELKTHYQADTLRRLDDCA